MVIKKNSFFAAIREESPLQVIGVTDPYAAIMADRAGFNALYLSSSGVAGWTYGLPDLGVVTRTEVFEVARRITSRVDLPLLVDCDAGFGSALGIARTVKEAEDAGISAIQIEDQVQDKRCGHRSGKVIVSEDEMVNRIKVAVDAKRSDSFCIMARTDAFGIEGLEGAIARANRYIEAGADSIFAEAMHTIDEYKTFTKNVSAPVLANMTEFGVTPLFSLQELKDAGVKIILYPLSAFRAMCKAAEDVFKSIRSEGDQKGVLDKMQSRKELYDYLGYYKQEKIIDQTLGADK